MNVSNIRIGTGLSQRDLKIFDGRSNFWQWDTGCQLRLIGCPDVSQMHFFRVGMSEPMTLSVYEVGSFRVCDVPDEILQDPNDFTVYAYVTDTDGNSTVYSKEFLIKDRPKPVGYIYTPTEVQTVESMVKAYVDKKFGDIEAVLDKIIATQNSLIGGEDV